MAAVPQGFTPRTAQPYIPPGAYAPQPMPMPYPMQPMMPPKANGMAIASLVCGIISLVMLFFGALTGPGIAIVGGVAIVLAIVAIILGPLALKQIRESHGTQGGRGMAITGLVLGSVSLALTILVMILVFVVAVAFIRACGGCRGASVVLPVMGLVIAAPSSRPRWDSLTAHHPDHPAFDRDVFHVHGGRVCASCLAFQGAGLGAAALLLLVPGLVRWDIAIALGVVLASAQVLSFVGLTARRWAKMGVKVAAGLGVALALTGVLHAPLPAWLRAGALILACVAPSLLEPLRARRLRNQLRAATLDG